MFPIGDDLPTLHRSWVTWALLAAIGAVWMLVQRGGFDYVALASSVCNYGLVPAELTGGQPVGTAVPLGPDLLCVVDDYRINLLTPVTSMFLHGSWGHLLGNALFLWVFGNNIEDSMGHGRFIVFYLLCGLAAAAAHTLLYASSPIPTVGASGAISGVLGGYLLLYPWSRVRMFLPPFFFFMARAWLVLIYWFGLQLLMGIPDLMRLRPEVSSGVAVWAHVGGFVAGAVLIHLFKRRDLVEAHRREVLSRHPVYGDRF